ncbi:MAG: extracellular solute-binding protein [Chloroflexi bacterium]|nr:extracellular solute-binding protein [Chloroflexota bacterium]
MSLNRQTSGARITRRGLVRGGLALASLGVISPILAACGGQPAAPEPAKPAVESKPAQSAPAPAATAAPQKASVELEYWMYETREAAVKSQDKWFKSAEEASGLKVNLVTISSSEIRPKVMASFAAKTHPDFMELRGELPTAWGAQGITVPMDDVLDTIGRSVWDASSVRYVTWKGKAYGAPWFSWPHVIWYRKDWYQEKGLKVPKTWEELWANAKALHDPPKRYGFASYHKAGDPKVIVSMMGINDAYVFDEKGNAAIGRAETANALKMVKQMSESSVPAFLELNEDMARLEFLKDRAAHMSTSVSMAYVIHSDSPARASQFAGFSFPIVKGDRGGYYSAASFSIMNPRNRDRTGTFIKTLLQPKLFVEYMKTTVVGWIPIIKTVYEDDNFWNAPIVKPFVEPMKAGVEASKNGVWTAQHFGPNPMAGPFVAEDILSKMVGRVIQEGQTAEAAAAWAQKETERIMKDNLDLKM